MYKTKGKKEKRPTFTFRTNRLNLDKLFYISEYNGKYMNDEIESLVENFIASFEHNNGIITEEDINKIKP